MANEKIYKQEKYNATGNTFVVIDLVQTTSENKNISESEKSSIVLKTVGDRDGVIFVEKHNEFYHMDYFNRDGNRAVFCGNGARVFAFHVNNLYYNSNSSNEFIFSTNAGHLKASISNSLVSVEMPKPKFLSYIKCDDFESDEGILEGALIEVGVIHVVLLVNDVDKIDLPRIASKIRWQFNANVNFFEIISQNFLKIRTYERGVERETLSCGSGITSAAYYYSYVLFKDVQSNQNNQTFPKIVKIQARGGELKVLFYENKIFLEGGVKNE